MAANQPLDTTIGVVTPENIAFEYQLAGPFRRLPAYLVDLVVRWAIIIVAGVLILIVGGMMSFFSGFFGTFAMAIGVIMYFLVSWFYGSFMEARFNGRTVGKWMCGIRVIDVDGRPVNGRSAILRNLLRVADLMPIAPLTLLFVDAAPVPILATGVIGLACMVSTKRLQRLGDLAAGTMVVVDERSWRLPVAKVDDARVPALAAFVPGDYRVTRSMARALATYAERRHYLTPARRREVARHLTDKLIERFEFQRDIDPDLLLYALYYKTFLADSSAEPADLGPLAGYSPLLRDAAKQLPSADNGKTPLTMGLRSQRETIQPIIASEATKIDPHSPVLPAQEITDNNGAAVIEPPPIVSSNITDADKPNVADASRSTEQTS
ncbi:RDD family protein [Stieleria varia]|uniref:RDD family protein n=1 Tax=Stieleria varia TaxID=2528005 RepID=A0A5C5ZVV3_9BACT|nr:RDD family protein [Stieleria varia]TWT91296.1 RDD family protein [Stieleria varia]